MFSAPSGQMHVVESSSATDKLAVRFGDIRMVRSSQMVPKTTRRLKKSHFCGNNQAMQSCGLGCAPHERSGMTPSPGPSDHPERRQDSLYRTSWYSITAVYIFIANS